MSRRLVAAALLPLSGLVALACRRPQPPAVCEPPPREQKVTIIGACPVDWGSGGADAEGDAPEAEDAGDSPEPGDAHDAKAPG
ncbi:MAG: hypothetical protein HYV09_19600 [Deltaproteobacteria bacterium]|nr:hypothetical protein [Deltaproteobacteria bacterium]